MNKLIVTSDQRKWVDITFMAQKMWEFNSYNLYELLLVNGEYGAEPIETQEQLNAALLAPDTIICIPANEIKDWLNDLSITSV